MTTHVFERVKSFGAVRAQDEEACRKETKEWS